jgi:hypothetical protein
MTHQQRVWMRQYDAGKVLIRRLFRPFAFGNTNPATFQVRPKGSVCRQCGRSALTHFKSSYPLREIWSKVTLCVVLPAHPRPQICLVAPGHCRLEGATKLHALTYEEF